MAGDQLLRRLPLVVDLDEVPQGGDLRTVPLRLHKDIDHTGLPGVGAGGGGLYESVAIIADEKTAGTLGGANNPATTWNTRELNTENFDPDGIVSIVSDQFTLQAGTYLIEARSMGALAGQRGALRLRNITDSTSDIIGTATSADDGLELSGAITIAAAKVFELQMWTTNLIPNHGENTGEVNIFTTVKITKLA